MNYKEQLNREVYNKECIKRVSDLGNEVTDYYKTHNQKETMSYYNIPNVKVLRKILTNLNYDFSIKKSFKGRPSSRTHESYVLGGIKSSKTQRDKFNCNKIIYFDNSLNNPRLLEIKEELEKNNIAYESNTNIDGVLFDFKALETLLEVDSIINPLENKNRSTPFLDNKYARNRHYWAKEHNYRCIHIFDWEDKEKIIQLLLPREKV